MLPCAGLSSSHEPHPQAPRMWRGAVAIGRLRLSADAGSLGGKRCMCNGPSRVRNELVLTTPSPRWGGGSRPGLVCRCAAHAAVILSGLQTHREVGQADAEITKQAGQEAGDVGDASEAGQPDGPAQSAEA